MSWAQNRSFVGRVVEATAFSRRGTTSETYPYSTNCSSLLVAMSTSAWISPTCGRSLSRNDCRLKSQSSLMDAMTASVRALSVLGTAPSGSTGTKPLAARRKLSCIAKEEPTL